MKKLLAILIVAMLALALVACADDTADLPENDEGKVEENVETPVEPEADENAPLTPANTLLKAFKDMKANGEYTDAETAANALITNPIIPFMGGAMAVEPGYLQGFANDIAGFKSGAVFMPMIGAIPFVGYVFELEEGADVDAFVQTLKDNADMRWFICTAAEEIVCEAVDNTVFFCMAKQSFEEEAPAEDEFFEDPAIDDLPVFPGEEVEPDAPAVLPEVDETPVVDDTPAALPEVDETPVVDDTPAALPEEELVPEEPVVEYPVEDAPVVEGDLTPANHLFEEFKTLLNDGLTGSLTLANALANDRSLPFMAGAMEVAEGFLNGFDEEIHGFKSGAVFMPMIGSIPFVGYVFELEEGADVDAFVQTLKDNANMRWLVCVAAEEIVCESVDNYVYFCMAKTSFEE
ncbi:MAG: hypothetical protein IJP16_10385 [Clostridia bacterium]|nr:hypothetical protein [Clostridia bacterium]